MNNGTVTKLKNNVPLIISNFYFRMKLLADFIKSDFKQINFGKTKHLWFLQTLKVFKTFRVFQRTADGQ